MQMKRSVVTSLLTILLSTPLIHAQDLSKYRAFSLRTSVTELTKQINKRPTDVVVVNDRPALIQQLTWWPPLNFRIHLGAEAVLQVRFSFYNDELYKIVVSYDTSATRGLTAEDMIQAMSQEYGTPTEPAPDIDRTDRAIDKVLAIWEDSQYSLNLFRSSLTNAFGLVLFVRTLDAQAEAAKTEAVRLGEQEAPQKELARAKKASDDLETQRQKNMKAFRP